MSGIFFTDHGNGDPVVFLHGYCESHRIWDYFDAGLSDSFRVICPDLPGFGYSLSLNSGFTLTAVADSIKAVLDDLKIHQCVIIGHSLGGYITLAFAEKYPEKLMGLGLFHSSAFEDSPEKKESRTKLMDFVRQNGVAPFVRTFVPSLFFEGNLISHEDAVKSVLEMAYETPEESVVEYARAMRDRPDRSHVLERFDHPVLFIIGEEDGSVPFDKNVMQSGIPQKPVVHVFKNTGHMGMFEKKEETLNAVRNFLEICYV